MTEVRALLFDAGNTRLKWAYFTRGRISKSGSVTHEQLHDKGYAALTSRMPRNVTHAAASNVAALWKRYQEWCRDSGVPRHLSLTRNHFYDQVEERDDVQIIKRNGDRGYAGVGLLVT